MRQSALVAQNETAYVVIELTVFRYRGGGKLGKRIASAVQGDGSFAVEAGIFEFLHVAANPVLQGGHVIGRENKTPSAVGAHLSAIHFVGYARVFELQFHAAHIGLLDGGNGLVKWVCPFFMKVPVPVGLHPGLVDAQLLPVFVSRSHVIGNPVQALACRMAILAKRRGNHVPVLVAAVYVYVVREVDFF